jgi:hypothetical protein
LQGKLEDLFEQIVAAGWAKSSGPCYKSQHFYPPGLAKVDGEGLRLRPRLTVWENMFRLVGSKGSKGDRNIWLVVTVPERFSFAALDEVSVMVAEITTLLLRSGVKGNRHPTEIWLSGPLRTVFGVADDTPYEDEWAFWEAAMRSEYYYWRNPCRAAT